MKQVLQLMKKNCKPVLWLSAESQPAAFTTKQTLQDFGSCVIHVKSSRLYINMGAVIFKKKKNPENNDCLAVLLFINSLQ